MDFECCKEVLLRSLLDALTEHVELIRESELKYQKSMTGVEGPWIQGGLRALSYDILPWQPFVALSFRTLADDCLSYSPADWKCSQLVGEHNARKALRPAIDFVWRAGQDAAIVKPNTCQEVNHLIYLAAAEALLNPSVVEILVGCGVDAKPITDRIPYREFAAFEFVVVDEDRVFKSNYCEIICAMRAAHQLLGRNPFVL